MIVNDPPKTSMLSLFACANIALKAESKTKQLPQHQIAHNSLMHVAALAGFIRRTKAKGLQFRVNGLIKDVRRGY